jgi:hypothetical protein
VIRPRGKHVSLARKPLLRVRGGVGGRADRAKIPSQDWGFDVGRRSSFQRRNRDLYPMPVEAVLPLLAHLHRHLEVLSGGGRCWKSDIHPAGPGIVARDAMALGAGDLGDAELIITNPPWSRPILHLLIEHLSDLAPAWLLLDAGWAYTRQSEPFLSRLRRIVAVGRLRWIEGSPYTGKDDAAWYLFDRPVAGRETLFTGRLSKPDEWLAICPNAPEG